jgi:hypothetical protein
VAVTTETLLGVATPVTVADEEELEPPPPPQAVISPKTIRASTTPHTFKKD